MPVVKYDKKFFENLIYINLDHIHIVRCIAAPDQASLKRMIEGRIYNGGLTQNFS